VSGAALTAGLPAVASLGQPIHMRVNIRSMRVSWDPPGHHARHAHGHRAHSNAGACPKTAPMLTLADREPRAHRHWSTSGDAGSMLDRNSVPGTGIGGPGRIRTCNQGIHSAPMFPKGVDYLFTRVPAAVGSQSVGCGTLQPVIKGARGRAGWQCRRSNPALR
jgi:hypothetical protein